MHAANNNLAHPSAEVLKAIVIQHEPGWKNETIAQSPSNIVCNMWHKPIPEEEQYVAKMWKFCIVFKSVIIVQYWETYTNRITSSTLRKYHSITNVYKNRKYVVQLVSLCGICIKMASAIWNQETKHRLNEKITSNVNDMGSLVRQITRGSKSTEVSLVLCSVKDTQNVKKHSVWFRKQQFFTFCLLSISA